MKNLLLSVIVTTYNRGAVLSRCLSCLANQNVSLDSFEVIVVDDGSTDNTKQICEDQGKLFSHFGYIHQQNSGQGNARNNALSKVSSEIVLFIGDDIFLKEDALFQHLEAHKKFPDLNVAVLGLTLWHPDLKITGFMKWLTNGKAGGPQFAYDLLTPHEFADYRFFYTSNISLKTKILKNEKFDPDFHSYGWEDIELSYRLTKKENLKIYYQPEAIGYHYHEITEESLKSRMNSIGKNALIFQKKWPEIKIVPGFLKKFAFTILSSSPILFLAKMLNKNFYYYALSKKYFLEGLI